MIHINKRTTNYQRIKLQVLVLLQKKNSEVLLLKKKKNMIRYTCLFLWKTKLHQKINVFFLWLVLRNKILTKDNLRKKTGKV